MDIWRGAGHTEGLREARGTCEYPTGVRRGFLLQEAGYAQEALTLAWTG